MVGAPEGAGAVGRGRVDRKSRHLPLEQLPAAVEQGGDPHDGEDHDVGGDLGAPLHRDVTARALRSQQQASGSVERFAHCRNGGRAGFGRLTILSLRERKWTKTHGVFAQHVADGEAGHQRVEEHDHQQRRVEQQLAVARPHPALPPRRMFGADTNPDHNTSGLDLTWLTHASCPPSPSGS